MHQIGNIAYLKLHRIYGDSTVRSTQLQVDCRMNEVIERMPIFCDVQLLFTAGWSSLPPEGEAQAAPSGNVLFRFRSTYNFSDSSLRVIRLGDIDNPNPLNFARLRTDVKPKEVEVQEANNDGGGATGRHHLGGRCGQNKRESKVPNIPMMIRCQNCDTNFPTKYQFQRHQCDFNAEKIVLKPNVDASSVEKGLRIKYDCKTCGKQFVSKNNLDRHLTSHDEDNVNICEYCNKHFVSENRLRIHKENHCKKAGDISKFYRSDITVWRCLKCFQVFSSEGYAVAHSDQCTGSGPSPAIDLSKEEEEEDNKGPVASEPEEPKQEDGEQAVLSIKEANEDLSEVGEMESATNLSTRPGDEPLNLSLGAGQLVDKVKTELLLQCEFCNRNYANKKSLMWHQKTHTTDPNYSCVVCSKSFESYVAAAKHWLTKCTIEANLFYLPKLIYCKSCDRTFKSHEILYTHKIKKKHYCQKRHVAGVLESDGQTCASPAIEEASVMQESAPEPPSSDDNNNNSGGSKQESIIELIENVLGSIKQTEEESAKQMNAESPEGGEEALDDEEDDDPDSMKSDAGPSTSGTGETKSSAKKKRGRKRKLGMPAGKGKKPAELEPGYKFQCERCVDVFDTVADLEDHRNRDHPANYKCEECAHVVHSSKALMIHSRAHQSLKPYVCEICKRCYSQTSHLWQHMRFHQGIKPFACPHEGCEARYTIRPDLKDHIRKVHTRERPFRCTVCNKCFLTGSVYYQHRLIHTNDRRYGCDVCKKRFFRADALNNHRRIHTDEKPYPCNACGRHFRQKGDRNKHMRTQHPGMQL